MSSVFTGTEGRVAGRVGVSGQRGPPGPTGPTGPNGMNGTDGVSGPSGPSGSSGPTGPSGSRGIDGVFELPSVIVNPSGNLGHMIYAVGTNSDDIEVNENYRMSSSSDNGTTWLNFGSLPALLKPRCCACNSSYLLIGGSAPINIVTRVPVGSDSYQGQHADITFNASLAPSISELGVANYPICTRIVWWPYHQKFLIVLRYAFTDRTTNAKSYTFQIWSLPATNTSSTLSYEAGSALTDSFDLIDINVNGRYAIALVYNYRTGESNMIYSTNAGTSWTPTTSETLTSYMSVLPYYGDSWLRFSSGQFRVNGAVAVSVTGNNFDSSFYPSSMGTLGSSYQVRTPTDAGFIYGAAFNGKVWCVITPIAYNLDNTVNNSPQVLKIFTSYDLKTALSGDVNNITFLDSNDPPRTQQIYAGYNANHGGLRPRIVWTGQTFIVFGIPNGSSPNAGILRSPNGFDWYPVSSQPAINNIPYISDICFTPASTVLSYNRDEYTLFMVSANTTFSGKMTRGLGSYLKNIGTNSVEVSTYFGFTNNIILLPANSTPYGGASKDAVITTDQNAPEEQQNTLLIN